MFHFKSCHIFISNRIYVSLEKKCLYENQICLIKYQICRFGNQICLFENQICLQKWHLYPKSPIMNHAIANLLSPMEIQVSYDNEKVLRLFKFLGVRGFRKRGKYNNTVYTVYTVLNVITSNI